ncbi:hypothetical protein ACFWH4_29725, partial [Streptomyces sp. NPDC127091]
MASVTSLTDLVNQQLSSALSATRPEASADPLLRRSDRADYQANGILALAKKAKANPRELATEVVAHLTTGDLIKDVEVSGPGFLNITVADRAITGNLAAGGGAGGGPAGGRRRKQSATLGGGTPHHH